MMLSLGACLLNQHVPQATALASVRTSGRRVVGRLETVSPRVSRWLRSCCPNAVADEMTLRYQVLGTTSAVSSSEEFGVETMVRIILSSRCHGRLEHPPSSLVA